MTGTTLINKWNQNIAVPKAKATQSYVRYINNDNSLDSS